MAGDSIAECTSDAISAAWFDSDPGSRFVAWFAREPSDVPEENCGWNLQVRYSTNGDDYAGNATHFPVMQDLLNKSTACVGVTAGTAETYAPTSPTAAPTSAVVAAAPVAAPVAAAPVASAPVAAPVAAAPVVASVSSASSVAVGSMAALASVVGFGALF